LDEVLQEPSVKSSKVRSLRHRISRVAAIVLLLIIPTIIILNRTKSTTDLLEDYLSIPYDTPPIARGEVDQNSTLWSQVALEYGNKNYNGAIASLKTIIESKETLSMAHFYSGLCYLYLENPKPKKAISHLQKVVNSENPFREQGLWYLSLAHLKNNHEALGKKTLESIGGYKVEEAQKLLDKLD
ncbi:MAG: tol-pal system YbgF family protein, partial [Allomuricauda sp.]